MTKGRQERKSTVLDAPVEKTPRSKFWCCCSLVDTLTRESEMMSLGEINVLTEPGAEKFLDLFYLPDETNPRKLSGDDRQRLMRLYAHFDRDQHQHISERDVRIGLSQLGNPPTVDEAKRMIAQLDLGRGRGSDGFVDFEEFALGLLHRRCLLYKALYDGHKLTGKPTRVDEESDQNERARLRKVAKQDAADPRARLSAVISAQTGRRVV